MVEDLVQKQQKSGESIEEVNNIIRHEIKKAFETVNIQSVAAPLVDVEQDFWPNEHDKYEEFKVLINDAIRALKNENTKEAQARLTAAYQQMSFGTEDQTSKLFMERAMRALKNENTKEAIATLELAYGI
jgi:outer membrane protein assembly factor BamD (BamD/ComL family)